MIVLAPLGAALILIALWDAFETMVLPRRVERRLRLARAFYRATWLPWLAVVRRFARDDTQRESLLSFFGPLSILMLLIVWAGVLIFGFAMMEAGLGSHLALGGRGTNFGTSVYMSATTFFTLGIGDVQPTAASSRALTAIESGMGFGFLALVIGYLPVLYQRFSRREVSISLLDARAGSPPSAGEMLRRYGQRGRHEEMEKLLTEWEAWSADLLESHLSYPVLAYFRSQHDRQSWLSAITAVLDFCALVLSCSEGPLRHEAELAFAMSRHTLVDLSQVFGRELRDPEPPRLSAEDVERLSRLLVDADLAPLAAERLRRLNDYRQMYEPYAQPLADLFAMPLPPWIPAAHQLDDWQASDRASIIG